MTLRLVSGELRLKTLPPKGSSELNYDPGFGNFVKRTLVALLIAALAFAISRLSDLVLLLFGAVLMAVGLLAVTRRLVQFTGIGASAGLAIVVLFLVGGIGLVLWLFGTLIAAQLDELTRQVPAGLSLAMERLRAHPYGSYAIEQAKAFDTAGVIGWAASTLAVVGRSLMRGLAYTVLTFFIAVYLAAQPDRYRWLCLRLIPSNSRPKAVRLFDETATILERWLLGQLVVMIAIGVLSGVGLWALGIEAAFTLGLVGGLLSFVPFVGAVLAAVPATLVALTQGPLYALSVVLMYVAVHFVEGNFITPMVQAEATALPPVLALLSTVAFSILFGPSAVLLAAPLTLFLMVVVEILYVDMALAELASGPLDGLKPQQPKEELATRGHSEISRDE